MNPGFIRLIRKGGTLVCEAGAKEGFVLARIAGLEKRDAPWHLRWFYGVMRRMFGKDLTPVKMQMRVPGTVWGSIGMEAGLGKKRRVSLRYVQLAKVRTAALVGCPF
jgi:hypothetical protein